ncbi:hypothetical protein SRIMM317S_00710 [Streptomyces rimosus subsp. rimosus]
MGGGRDLQSLVPADADQAAFAAGLLIPAAFGRVPGDLGPGRHRVAEPGPRFPEHFHQHAARIRITHPRRRVRVPGKGRSARTSPRLVLRAVGAHRRVIRLLCFPGDEPVFDEHLPGTRACAIHTVGRAHHLVVRPPLTVRSVVDLLVRAVDRAPVRCRGGPLQLPAEPQQPFRRRTRHTFRCLACSALRHVRTSPLPMQRHPVACQRARAQFRPHPDPEITLSTASENTIGQNYTQRSHFFTLRAARICEQRLLVWRGVYTSPEMCSERDGAAVKVRRSDMGGKEV